MKTTIFILGDNNFWYSTIEVEYQNITEIEKHVADAIADVQNRIRQKEYEFNDATELTVVLGEIKFTNINAN
jgi:hypothetical protein